MPKRKIAAVVTSRASYARVKSALLAIQKHPKLELQLIAAASTLLEKYGRAVNVLEKDGFRPAARVYMVLEGENPTTMAKTTGIGIMELSTAFDNLRPDAVLTVADRYETISTAIAASYMNIPLVHIQGGELTGSIDDRVRHAVTKLSNYHFVSNENAKKRVIQMGEDSKNVHVTGCPSIDIAAQAAKSGKVNFNPFTGTGPKFDISNGYIIVMQHPVTTEYEEAGKQTEETLAAVSSLKKPTLWFWPNVDAGADQVSKRLRIFREKQNPDYIHFCKNFAPEQFLQLLNNALCIVGNSSVAIREASYLGVPAVNIGTREEGRDRGKNTVDVEYKKREILKAIQKQLQAGRYPKDNLYGNGNAGSKIADLLASLPLTHLKKTFLN